MAVLYANVFDGDDMETPVSFGATPVQTGPRQRSYLKETKSDSERKHTSEQVAYIVFE